METAHIHTLRSVIKGLRNIKKKKKKEKEKSAALQLRRVTSAAGKKFRSTLATITFDISGMIV